MIESKVLFKTWSICPVCMKRLPAERVQKGNEVFLRKTCSDHGTFETIIWRGFSDINEWVSESDSPALENPRCPDSCGLCPDHLQKTCCVVLNITSRCNLNCRFCFAERGNKEADPSFEEIKEWLLTLTEKGKSLVQLSGGEPTVREDLPEIIRAARDAGAKYVQLNTNGIRLAEDEGYVKQLADAGLSFVFMQFDGTNDSIYKQLRGRPLLDVKKRAIDKCSEFNIGVTLVPILVRGVNVDNIGDMIRFAVSRAPEVRGVHFQPVSFIGRIEKTPEDSQRITLDELMNEIVCQTNGMIRPEYFKPSECNHHLCGFHADFMAIDDRLIFLSKQGSGSIKSCCQTGEAERRREFIGRRWKRAPEMINEKTPCLSDISDMDLFLKLVKRNGFTLTSMAFQDAGNIDFSRLRKCSLHVFDEGRLVPFCSYYLSGWKI